MFTFVAIALLLQGFVTEAMQPWAGRLQQAETWDVAQPGDSPPIAGYCRMAGCGKEISWLAKLGACLWVLPPKEFLKSPKNPDGTLLAKRVFGSGGKQVPLVSSTFGLG
jgi:hypothetical protein